ncbi:PIG-L family deacetylase [uncultured Psychroserpens sp.]|uniref:PIG-L family deacetylase n=1 Tax=uncultured Psychroserpens sp. TaxID=255436 RepID=UPI002622AFF8|nr:PIG-L family deacetylase [uncultured Psychroserpens sp.]
MNYKFYFLLLSLILVSCNNNQVNYKKIASFQDHSIKNLEISADKNTRVLLIFPHADDEITCVGLTSYLKSKGAKIHMLTLGHSSETKINETRIEELNCSATKMGVEKLEIAGLIINKWDDIMNDNISFWYDKKDSIKAIISDKIKRYKPQILITYDTEIGGYGHPEHRISAQLTEEIFHEKKSDSTLYLEKIYQFSLPEKLENFMLSNIPAYDYSKKLTNSEGLPNPDVALNIADYWKIKNDVALCHESQFKILNKFHMIAKKGELKNHSEAFSKEYYTVIE